MYRPFWSTGLPGNRRASSEFDVQQPEIPKPHNHASDHGGHAHGLDPRTIFTQAFWSQTQPSVTAAQEPDSNFLLWQGLTSHVTACYNDDSPHIRWADGRYGGRRFPAPNNNNNNNNSSSSSNNNNNGGNGPPTAPPSRSATPPSPNNNSSSSNGDNRPPTARPSRSATPPSPEDLPQPAGNRPPTPPSSDSSTEGSERGGTPPPRTPYRGPPRTRPPPPPPPHAYPAPGAIPPPPSSSSPHFLFCAGYRFWPIRARKPFRPPGMREGLLDALTSIDHKPTKGIGALARPVLLPSGISPGKLLNHFLADVDRVLLVPTGSTLNPPPPPCLCPFYPKKEPDARGLAHLESELFDTGKYVGGGASANYLTVLTWSDDSAVGSITLFEADVEYKELGKGWAGLGGGPRVERVPIGTVQKVRPIAAMEDVPREILINMRRDPALKKVALKHDSKSGRFRWTSMPATKHGSPNYAQVPGGRMFVDVLPPRSRSSTSSGYSSDADSEGSPDRDRGRRVERVRHSEDIHGVVATLPQFLALLHASGSVFEAAASSPVSLSRVKTADGEWLRSVKLPASTVHATRHRDRGTHVIVLMPDGDRWADERIFWSDGEGDLTLWQQKKYHDVIAEKRQRMPQKKPLKKVKIRRG